MAVPIREEGDCDQSGSNHDFHAAEQAVDVRHHDTEQAEQISLRLKLLATPPACSRST